jgi:hypothetical protein
MPTLDLKLLKEAVANRKAHRPPEAGPGGRRLTGSKQIVRDNFVRLTKMQKDGATWVDIAEGLAAQGVTQGNNEPITAKRLTALISAVKKERAKKLVIAEVRASRPDLRVDVGGAKATAAINRGQERLSLSPELTKTPSSIGPDHRTEEDIRRANFEKHSALFRKE